MRIPTRIAGRRFDPESAGRTPETGSKSPILLLYKSNVTRDVACSSNRSVAVIRCFIRPRRSSGLPGTVTRGRPTQGDVAEDGTTLPSHYLEEIPCQSLAKATLRLHIIPGSDCQSFMDFFA